MDIHAIEYEVITDANFVGEATCGDYYFTIWDYDVHRRGQARLLCLRIKQKESLPSLPPTKAKEFIYLASLFLRRRLILGPMTRWDDKPSRHPSRGPTDIEPHSHEYVDGDVVRDPATNLKDLEVWLPLIENLDRDTCYKFILAARFYSQALELIEVRADVAYLNFVSAIETLSKDVDIGKPTIDDLGEGWEDLINKIPDLKLRREFTEKLVEERFFRRKFVKLIEQHIVSDRDFWDYERRPRQRGRIDPNDLDRLLKNIYDQRCRTLHDGEPFPDYVFYRASLPGLEKYPEDIFINKKIIIRYEPMGEIPVGTSMTSGGRTWKSKDYIPYPHFFERLVNHVLKNYLKANQTIKHC